MNVKKVAPIGSYPKGQFYLPTEKQKPQIDFLRFLCYNRSCKYTVYKGFFCDKAEL